MAQTESANLPLAPARAGAKMLDVQAVSAMLSCSTRHVYRLSDAGKMPAPIKLGSLVRWSAVALSAWIDAGCPRFDVRPARRPKGPTIRRTAARAILRDSGANTAA